MIIGEVGQPSGLYFEVEMKREKLKKFRIFSFGEKSGSYSLSEQITQRTLNELDFKDKKVKWVDLRRERHIFINGFSLLCSPKKEIDKESTPDEIKKEEHQLVLNQKEEGKSLPLFIEETIEKKDVLKKVSFQNIESVMTEEELIENACGKGSYERLPVQSHYGFPDASVDRLIELVKDAKKNNRAIHFHDDAGRGRTSQAIAYCTMIEQANKKSVDEILEFLKDNGNIELIRKDRSEDKQKRRPETEYWNKFHAFCVEKAWESTTWSKWIEAKIN